jgi:hypothetical protein
MLSPRPACMCSSCLARLEVTSRLLLGIVRNVATLTARTVCDSGKSQACKA